MHKSLEDLRKEIDELDHQILDILAKRFSVVKQVGDLKTVKNLPIVDEKRREELLETLGQKAKQFGLSADFIKKLFKEIHDHAMEMQKRI